MNIVAESLSYAVNQVELVSEVSISLNAGETVVLLGPNGAGKSTLLRLLSGYLSPAIGSVKLDGRLIEDYSFQQRADRLSVLTQNNQLDFPFTVREVIEMGVGRGTANHLVGELVARLALDAERIYPALSGGERQLVQLARVMAQIGDKGDQASLLLDEPMSALDLRYQQEVASLLSEYRQNGTGQLIVLHDINMAADIADRVVLMADGKVVAQGETQTVLTSENLQRTFDTAVSVHEVEGRQFFRAAVQPQAERS